MEEVLLGPAHDSIRWYASAGELTVLDSRRGRAVVLNESAAAVFHACDGSRSLPQVIHHVSQRAGVLPTEVAADVSDLVDQLVHQGLLSEHQPARGGSQP